VTEAVENEEGKINEMLTLDLIMLAACTAWVLWQYRRTKILLAPSNAFLAGNIILAVFVAYPLALSPESLAAIGQSAHAVSIQWAADELLGVICVGTICLILGYWVAPRLFPRLAGKPRELPHSPRVSLFQLTVGACVVCLVGVASVFLFFIQQGMIPLLSSTPHAREILLMGHPLRYIYMGGFMLANTGAVFLMGGLSLGKIRRYRPLCFFAITMVTIANLCTASRGNLLAPFVSAGLIYFSLRNTNLTVFRACCLAVLLLCCASGLQLIRAHAGLSFEGLWYELIHGSTFFGSFRDSSWVLRDFEANRYPLFYGKTILAGLLGFVPSSVLPFRQQYSWGPVALNILNRTGDPFFFGPGQVLFADWYLNFGTAGVVLEGLVIGVLLRWLDARLFQIRRVPRDAAPELYFLLFGLWFRFEILGSLCASANVMLVYPQVLAYMLILALAYGVRQIFGARIGGGGRLVRRGGLSTMLEPPHA
jgi:oligosaccharide repeat unit polymerase